ncbi:MAG: carbohydrate kinase family protein [Rhizobiaceae bacterium]|nr:carbohydrate kinase family protein [Rhizobiaceae bacterium]MCV0408832.1 carbohydrate kinase family protein [Rhizobiaceae bacterium]
MTRPGLLAVGGAHVDRRGRVSGAFVPGASNPGHMREDVGGGAFNAARCAVRHGLRAAMFSVRGGDRAGTTVAEAIAAAGMADLSVCYLDRATPSYTAILDTDGEPVAALADMELYEIAFAKQVRRRAFRDAVAEADAILIDANLPEPAIAGVLAASSGRPVHAIGVSPAKVVRLRPHLAALSGVFLNRREAAALAAEAGDGPRGGMADTGADFVVVTDGSREIEAWRGGRCWRLVPPRPEHVADATGAGDALAGAMVAALSRGISFPEALRCGVAAAVMTVAAMEAVAEDDDTVYAAVLDRVPEPRLEA